jgi:hypothetical protein
MEPIARQLYQEISLIEQEHVTHYESLLDPGETWWERLLTHEYNECWLYWSFMEQESDPRVKAVWELHLQMELAHLQQAADLLRRHDGREPEQVVGDTGLPEPLKFEPNKEYLRHLLATVTGGLWHRSTAQCRLDDPDRLGGIDADAGDDRRVVAGGAAGLLAGVLAGGRDERAGPPAGLDQPGLLQLPVRPTDGVHG